MILVTSAVQEPVTLSGQPLDAIFASRLEMKAAEKSLIVWLAEQSTPSSVSTPGVVTGSSAAPAVGFTAASNTVEGTEEGASDGLRVGTSEGE